MLCGKSAFFLRPYSGEAFCRRCYPRTFEKRVSETITGMRMLRPIERLAVAVSGGKDSVSLLHVLTRIERRFPQVQIIAFTVDEGISGYRREAIEIAASNAKQLGIEHRVVSFKSLYGHDLDEVAHRVQELKLESVCAYCGILRRKALNVAAKEVEATKLATAHNLDDEAQSLIMSLLRGAMDELLRSKGESTGFVPRIKPFMRTPEREIALYAHVRRIRFQSIPCPYAGTSLRNEVRCFLDIVEEMHPGMKFAVPSTFGKLRPTESVAKTGGRCRVCNEPAFKTICRACQVLKNLGLRK